METVSSHLSNVRRPSTHSNAFFTHPPHQRGYPLLMSSYRGGVSLSR